LTTAFNSNGVK